MSHPSINSEQYVLNHVFRIYVFVHEVSLMFCVRDSQLHSKLSEDQFHHPSFLLRTTLRVNLMLSCKLAMLGETHFTQEPFLQTPWHDQKDFMQVLTNKKK